MRSPPLFFAGVVIALVVAALDQVSKWQVLDAGFRIGDRVVVTSYFNLVLVWNRGVSFGIWNNDSEMNAWVLSILAIAIAAAMLVWLWRTGRRTIMVAVGLVVGGAVGNVIDRLLHGAVVDFLDFHAFGYHWPAFNVADSAITVGALVLVADALFAGAEAPKTKS